MVSWPVELNAAEGDDDKESDECLSLLTTIPNRTGCPGFGCPSNIVLGAVSNGISIVGGLFDSGGGEAAFTLAAEAVAVDAGEPLLPPTPLFKPVAFILLGVPATPLELLLRLFEFRLECCDCCICCCCCCSCCCCCCICCGVPGILDEDEEELVPGSGERGADLFSVG